ncbi:O-antigen ligase family protein [Moheibacter lacus]|uniref:O-antigen ligase family protein n=1 Tax=Moheibacter lacus TaxID=2745851 RepID=A0A838ZL75_9FLAO|nr:O-antigen ligase family protein [Moheibacter lacus]MBA5629204.1 O-antigen ligase family protein [Moheibacter lacus]
MSLRKIYTILFALGVFFIPFNEFEGMSFLGEYSDESATYFFLIGFVFVIIESGIKGKFSFPYRNSLSILLICFILWTVLSALINFETISTSYFKHTSGISRYIRQSISMLISAVIFTILFWNVIKNYSVMNIFLFIRKIFLFSFIFVSVYGFIEIAIVFFGMSFLIPVLESFDIFPFVNTSLSIGRRLGISSITFEIPALGTYLLTILPWMVSYIFTEKKVYKYIPLGVILVLLFFSDSRSALIIISVQLLVLLFLFIYDIRFRAGTIRILKYGVVLIFLLTLFKSEQIINTFYEKTDRINFSKNLTKNVSNKSRFGMQYAAIQVFKENPITGVGIGQLTYHSRDHYPYWATVNNYEYDLFYKNQNLKSFPPIYNFHIRVIAELGLIGIIIWLSLLFLTIYYSLLYWKFSSNQYRFIGVILLLSFIGLSINWLQVDHFKQYGFWLCLILLIKCRLDFRKDISNQIK